MFKELLIFIDLVFNHGIKPSTILNNRSKLKAKYHENHFNSNNHQH